jgi:dihydrofolate synthase/folylpolyglutamate synthase
VNEENQYVVGRLQVAGDAPLVLLDGAHNPAGCEALARTLKDLGETGRYGRLCLVFGVLQDKDLEPMAGHLFPLASRVILTRGRSGRFRDPGDVAAVAKAMGFKAEVIHDLPSALAAARSTCAPDDAICLTGSLYLVGDALEAMGLDPYR